jgi:hypothetical protein
LPGKGDGTFGTPTPFSQNGNLFSGGQILYGDLNNDKKIDLIWNGAVYLGNGDGTFRQLPLGITLGTNLQPLAIADLNGDGFADLVVGPNIYAGNGNGTFQSSPFYTATLPQYTSLISASIGDVNADGHPDVLFQYSMPYNTMGAALIFGTGARYFTSDGNTYYAGSLLSSGSAASPGTLVRLNNKAPMSPNDNALDYLTFTSGPPLFSIRPTPHPLPRPHCLQRPHSLSPQIAWHRLNR